MRKLLFVVTLFFSFYCSAQNFYLLVGTYTQKGSKGIYVYRFNATTGKAEWVSNTDSAANPSFVINAPDEKHVYAVNETGGKNPGMISSYAFDKSTGKLSFINQQPTGGDAPCYLAITKDGKWITVANYTGGSLSAFAVNKDGSLKPYSQLIQHTGSSVNSSRQEKPHVHETVFSPSGDYLFTPDLGTDKVTIYAFNPASTKPLAPAATPFIAVNPGNGPRHITFHPNGKYAYVIEELSGTVGAYTYSNGNLSTLQTIATHPAGFKGMPGSAEVELSPDSKFLYASNRGEENNIAIFSVNAATGKLELKGYQSTLGKAPRHFIMDPTGAYLLAANQDSDNIVIFKRNKQTGMLQDTGNQIKVSMPVCVQLLK
ncbi:MAG: lactonase family protein [Bacteroidota bacterium]|nr:lactonase family protein [Bacteroidota bacterium]